MPEVRGPHAISPPALLLPDPRRDREDPRALRRAAPRGRARRLPDPDRGRERGRRRATRASRSRRPGRDRRACAAVSSTRSIATCGCSRRSGSSRSSGGWPARSTCPTSGTCATPLGQHAMRPTGASTDAAPRARPGLEEEERRRTLRASLRARPEGGRSQLWSDLVAHFVDESRRLGLGAAWPSYRAVSRRASAGSCARGARRRGSAPAIGAMPLKCSISRRTCRRSCRRLTCGTGRSRDGTDTATRPRRTPTSTYSRATQREIRRSPAPRRGALPRGAARRVLIMHTSTLTDHGDGVPGR